jgi:DNA replication protein DnaC
LAKNIIFDRPVCDKTSAPVLIIDDWGLEVLTRQQRTDLLEVIEDRNGNGSTIITSQLPATLWHEAIGDPTLADAILQPAPGQRSENTFIRRVYAKKTAKS